MVNNNNYGRDGLLLYKNYHRIINIIFRPEVFNRIITSLTELLVNFFPFDTQKISIFSKIKRTYRYKKICVINAKYCMNTGTLPLTHSARK